MADAGGAPSAVAPASPAAVEPAGRRPSRRRRIALLAALSALPAALAIQQAVVWPDVARLARERPSSTAFIDAWRARQRAAGRVDRPDWRWVPYGSIAPTVKIAVVVSEDIEFFAHDGFSRAEIRAALEDAWQEGRPPRGASTITQQVAKNLWLSPSRNPWRKVKEALLTRGLERHLTKRRILEIYLNVAEFGPGIYGVEAASRRYFGKPAGALDAGEAARLAAALPNPAAWNPGRAAPAAGRRAAAIQARMARASGWLEREI